MVCWDGMPEESAHYIHDDDVLDNPTRGLFVFVWFSQLGLMQAERAESVEHCLSMESTCGVNVQDIVQQASGIAVHFLTPAWVCWAMRFLRSAERNCCIIFFPVFLYML